MKRRPKIDYLDKHSLDGDAVSAREKLARVIAADPGRIGQVFRLTAQGMGVRQIADSMGLPNSNYVYLNWDLINACLDGKVSPRSISAQEKSLDMMDGLVARAGSVPSPALRRLGANRERVRAAYEAACEALRAREAVRGMRDGLPSFRGFAGIYVYSYNSLLNQPGPNVMFKVGVSRNVGERLRQQQLGPRDGYPEPMTVCRVYAGDGTLATEKYFHDHLKEAGHVNPNRGTPTNRTGTEWFKTNLDFLDELADSLGMITVYSRPVVEAGALDEGSTTSTSSTHCNGAAACLRLRQGERPALQHGIRKPQERI